MCALLNDHSIVGNNIMPVYTFRDTVTNEEFDIMMSIKDLDDYRKQHPHHEKVIGAPNIVSGVSITGKLDDGFKDVMSKIAEAHPDSEVARSYGRKSIKQAQTQRAIQKWRSSST